MVLLSEQTESVARVAENVVESVLASRASIWGISRPPPLVAMAWVPTMAAEKPTVNREY